jgi:hypothetical protein
MFLALLGRSDEHPMIARLRSTLASLGEQLSDMVAGSILGGVQLLVAEQGEGFVGRERPKTYRSRRKKECYSNSVALTLAREGLSYVEGFVAISTVPVPIEHAWCVDEEGVVDVTLKEPEKAFYLGIRFSRAEIAAHVASGSRERPLVERVGRTS